MKHIIPPYTPIFAWEIEVRDAWCNVPSFWFYVDQRTMSLESIITFIFQHMPDACITVQEASHGEAH